MKSYKLLIDADRISFRKFAKNFQQIYGVGIILAKVRSARVYKTKKGWHIYITLFRAVSAETICFLQVIYGSDKAREILNWRRLVKLQLNPKLWNILFSKKFDSSKRMTSSEKWAPRQEELINEIIYNANIQRGRQAGGG